MPLMGGLMNYGYQCGMVWGASLAAGAQAYRLLGTGPQAETAAIISAKKVAESFAARYRSTYCLEITNLNWKGKIQVMKLLKFFIKGGPIGCLNMAVKYSPIAYNEINTAFSEVNIETPSPPVSCAAILARKMGASVMHTVMVAGLAGGIGLSGGACGALAAAVWYHSMNSIKARATNKVINSKAGEIIGRFLKGPADFRLECSKIVGRRFENIGSHAAYLHDGGCTEIIEGLASQSTAV